MPHLLKMSRLKASKSLAQVINFFVRKKRPHPDPIRQSMSRNDRGCFVFISNLPVSLLVGSAGPQQASRGFIAPALGQKSFLRRLSHVGTLHDAFGGWF